MSARTALRPPVGDRFGIEHPIFGFAHSTAVVAGVSNAGGLGVFGRTHSTPAQITASLRTIRAGTDSRPFGVDLVALLPVFAAGGVATGRHIAAALAAPARSSALWAGSGRVRATPRSSRSRTCCAGVTTRSHTIGL